MLIDLERYIKKNALLESNDKILCAVSGGVDSITLAVLLSKLGYDISIAHCNFSLRADEADGDEQLVCDFAKSRSLTFHRVRFQTKEYAQNNGLSIQMAARKLRYDWFEELSQKYGYTKIAIAHNAGDAIETFFINLIRSTGVDGLEGIKPHSGKIVRPLLFASRGRIEAFAQSNSVEYRTDSSNLSTYYLRNWIRLKLLPKICEKQQNFSETMLDNMQHIASHNSLFAKMLERVKSEVFLNENQIALSKIKEYGSDSYQLLYQLVKPMGFSMQNCRSILSVKGSGRVFSTQTHRALVDREHLILEPICQVFNLGDISRKRVDCVDFKSLMKNQIYIDSDKVKGELRVRVFKKGDIIYPLGMRGKKLVSDLLTDIKLSLFEKERQPIVEDDNGIVWVVGRCQSERCKITEQTKNIELITYNKI